MILFIFALFAIFPVDCSDVMVAVNNGTKTVKHRIVGNEDLSGSVGNKILKMVEQSLQKGEERAIGEFENQRKIVGADVAVKLNNLTAVSVNQTNLSQEEKDANKKTMDELLVLELAIKTAYFCNFFGSWIVVLYHSYIVARIMSWFMLFIEMFRSVSPAMKAFKEACDKQNKVIEEMAKRGEKVENTSVTELVRRQLNIRDIVSKKVDESKADDNDWLGEEDDKNQSSANVTSSVVGETKKTVVNNGAELGDKAESNKEFDKGEKNNKEDDRYLPFVRKYESMFVKNVTVDAETKKRKYEMNDEYTKIIEAMKRIRKTKKDESLKSLVEQMISLSGEKCESTAKRGACEKLCDDDRCERIDRIMGLSEEENNFIKMISDESGCDVKESKKRYHAFRIMTMKSSLQKYGRSVYFMLESAQSIAGMLYTFKRHFGNCKFDFNVGSENELACSFVQELGNCVPEEIKEEKKKEEDIALSPDPMANSQFMAKWENELLKNCGITEVTGVSEYVDKLTNKVAGKMDDLLALGERLVKDNGTNNNEFIYEVLEPLIAKALGEEFSGYENKLYHGLMDSSCKFFNNSKHLRYYNITLIARVLLRKDEVFGVDNIEKIVDVIKVMSGYFKGGCNVMGIEPVKCLYVYTLMKLKKQGKLSKLQKKENSKLPNKEHRETEENKERTERKIPDDLALKDFQIHTKQLVVKDILSNYADKYISGNGMRYEYAADDRFKTMDDLSSYVKSANVVNRQGKHDSAALKEVLMNIVSKRELTKFEKEIVDLIKLENPTGNAKAAYDRYVAYGVNKMFDEIVWSDVDELIKMIKFAISYFECADRRFISDKVIGMHLKLAWKRLKSDGVYKSDRDEYKKTVGDMMCWQNGTDGKNGFDSMYGDMFSSVIDQWLQGKEINITDAAGDGPYTENLNALFEYAKVCENMIWRFVESNLVDEGSGRYTSSLKMGLEKVDVNVNMSAAEKELSKYEKRIVERKRNNPDDVVWDTIHTKYKFSSYEQMYLLYRKIVHDGVFCTIKRLVYSDKHDESEIGEFVNSYFRAPGIRFTSDIVGHLVTAYLVARYKGTIKDGYKIDSNRYYSCSYDQQFSLTKKGKYYADMCHKSFEELVLELSESSSSFNGVVNKMNLNSNAFDDYCGEDSSTLRIVRQLKALCNEQKALRKCCMTDQTTIINTLNFDFNRLVKPELGKRDIGGFDGFLKKGDLFGKDGAPDTVVLNWFNKSGFDDFENYLKLENQYKGGYVGGALHYPRDCLLMRCFRIMHRSMFSGSSYKGNRVNLHLNYIMERMKVNEHDAKYIYAYFKAKCLFDYYVFLEKDNDKKCLDKMYSTFVDGLNDDFGVCSIDIENYKDAVKILIGMDLYRKEKKGQPKKTDEKQEKILGVLKGNETKSELTAYQFGIS